jgi:hypothetical protein
VEEQWGNQPIRVQIVILWLAGEQKYFRSLHSQTVVNLPERTTTLILRAHSEDPHHKLSNYFLRSDNQNPINAQQPLQRNIHAK